MAVALTAAGWWLSTPRRSGASRRWQPSRARWRWSATALDLAPAGMGLRVRSHRRGGAYIALVTALWVVSLGGPATPAGWVLPTLVGLPLIERRVTGSRERKRLARGEEMITGGGKLVVPVDDRQRSGERWTTRLGFVPRRDEACADERDHPRYATGIERYRALPRAELAICPQLSHAGPTLEHASVFASLIQDFARRHAST